MMTTQTAPQTIEPNVQVTRKSGKGIADGVVSELSAFFGVIPGHEAELRAACARFADMLRATGPEGHQKTGLRDSKHVLFDNGTRLLWTTTFETDWDPYLDDALMIGGVDNFIDWMQHTTEAQALGAWMRGEGGAEQLRQIQNGAVPQGQVNSGGLKRIIQSVQIQGAGYFNALANKTMPEIAKATRVEQAFQQLLDGPDAEAALAHPGLAPLLEQAAD